VCVCVCVCMCVCVCVCTCVMAVRCVRCACQCQPGRGTLPHPPQRTARARSAGLCPTTLGIQTPSWRPAAAARPLCTSRWQRACPARPAAAPPGPSPPWHQRTRGPQHSAAGAHTGAAAQERAGAQGHGQESALARSGRGALMPAWALHTSLARCTQCSAAHGTAHSTQHSTAHSTRHTAQHSTAQHSTAHSTQHTAHSTQHTAHSTQHTAQHSKAHSAAYTAHLEDVGHAVLQVRLGAGHVVRQVCKRELRLDHPKLGQVAARV
jgi:hypothetical protein